MKNLLPNINPNGSSLQLYVAGRVNKNIPKTNIGLDNAVCNEYSN